MVDDATATLRVGLSIPNLAEPGRLVELGVAAEAAGWDGVLLWDHAHGSPEMPMPMADPWVVLGALAMATRRVRLGTAITALARRRPQKVARETVTLDHLSGGRAVLGVGLGEPPEEHTAYGESADPAVLAAKLDESLDVLAHMWSGERFHHHGEHLVVHDAQFLPTPVQRPRIPVWASCMYPHTAPLRRAARWDGVILGRMGEGGALEALPPGHLERCVAELGRLRGDLGGFDVVVAHPEVPGAAERAELSQAGATWVLVSAWIDQVPDVVASLDR